MRAAEEVFNPAVQQQPEYQWTYRYVLVKHGEEVLAAAPLTTSILKDDTFMTSEVSRAIEDRRREDPYLFSSLALTTGTMASEGLHIYLREGPLRTEALVRLLETAVAEARQLGCRTLVFGDFPDPRELSPVFTAQGFVPMQLLDNHVLHLDWRGEDDFIQRLASRAKRRHVRDIHAQAERFRCEVWGAGTEVSDAVLLHLHELYLRIARKNLRINIFPLPAAIFRAHLGSGAWEFLVLYDTERAEPEPVAFAAGCRVGADHRWLYCGVDYTGYDVEVTSPYRQLLWEMIRHPARRGAARVHVGMGSDQEKLKFGTTPVPTYAFVRTDDDYQAAKLQEFVERLTMGRRLREGRA
jgi:predicted N-acyltransferase